MSSYVIEQILKHKKITDYLSSKGIHPKGHEVNGKLRYNCPIHTGDKTPSFMVYLNGEFENFFCYGCKAKYHIVHLYCYLEGVSIGDSIKALSGDLKLDVEAELTHAINEIETDKSILHEYSPPQLALIIGRQMYEYFKAVKTPKAAEQSEKVNQLIDNSLVSNDIATLLMLYDTIPDVVAKAVRLHMEEVERKILQ